jgi:hypothetical protein
MKALRDEPEILRMANALRVGPGDPVEQIIAFCKGRVESWCGKGRRRRTIEDIERIVCEKLNLVFEEFGNEDELASLVNKYVSMGEAIFATLPGLFDEKTYATLIERRKINRNSRDRYIAVIDCRGGKAARRFFTRWHEISHLLTLYDQLELPLHRSTAKKTPTERLMDTIAGEVGFFDPILKPIVDAELSSDGRLSFEAVERIRTRYSPTASFQSTLNACVRRAYIPAAVLEAGLGFKKREVEQVETLQLALIPCDPPKPKIRVLSFVPNEYGRGKIQLHRNMEVPATSPLVTLLRSAGPLMDQTWVEDLGTWEHSDGSRLPSALVRFEARRIKDHVLALIQFANP